jgi:glycosyltransferase involved in cell wall biosynthesis
MQSKYGSYCKTALRSLIYLDSSLYFAKKIVAISQTTYKDILHFRPNLPIQEKLITISNGANSSLAQLPAVEINAPTTPFLLSVGRIDPASKNLPQAVNLTRALREKSGQPYSLHFIGGMNASSETEGKAFIKSIEEISWAVYHGYVDNNNLAQWYRTATAIVFLSDNEGFGFPIAEAASFQKWSIVSDKNQTAFEAGGEALIPINIDEPEKSVSEVLTKLKQGKPPTVELQSWETTAQLYSDLINEVLVN